MNIIRSYKYKVMGIATILAMALSFLPAFTNHASALGESFTWKDARTITMSGGEMTNTVDLVQTGSSLPTGGVFRASVDPIFRGNPNCVLHYQITVNAANSGATSLASIVQSAGGTPANPSCDSARASQNSNKSVSVSGSRPGTGGLSETPAQRAVNIRVDSPEPASNSPASITITIKNASGGVVQTATAAQQTLEPGKPAAQRGVYYESHFELDGVEGAGTAYSVCFDAVIPGCQAFNKVKFSPLNKTYGQTISATAVNIIANIKWSEGPLARQVGPIDVTLTAKDEGGSNETIQTNSFQFTPSAAQKDAGSIIAHTTTLNGVFTGVTAGNYTACIPKANLCKDFAKGSAADTITFNIEGADGLAIATGSASTGADQTPPCQKNGDPLTWVLCPIFNGLAGAADFILNNLLQPLLVNSPVGLSANDNDYKIWSNFRIYGDIFLVAALLVAAMLQAFGGGVGEAYAKRKVVSRIFVAAILLNLSIYIVAFAVDAANIIGASIGSIIIAPIRESAQFTFTPNLQQAGVITVVGGGLGGALIAGFVTMAIFSSGLVLQSAIFIALFVIMPAVLAMIGAFITIILLHGLILALIIVSPVAFALYCLPNTEKYFKMWWDWLFRALLVYPIIMIIFALADVMTVMIQQGNDLCGGNTSAGGVGACTPLLGIKQVDNILAAVVAFVVQFLPLLLIPFAFKMAGGLVGRIGELIKGYRGKIGETVKGNVNDPDALRNRVRKNTRGAFVRGQAGAFRHFNANSGWASQRLAMVAGSGNILDKEAALNEDAKKRIGRTKDNGDDSILNARTSVMERNARTGKMERRTLDGKLVSDAEWGLANQYYKTMGEVQAVEGYRETKTLSEEDAQNYTRRFGMLADQEGWSDDETNSHWIATGFARQDERGEMKHGRWGKDTTGQRVFTPVGGGSGTRRAQSFFDTKKGGPTDDPYKKEGGTDAFIREAYNKKGSPRAAMMLSTYPTAMKDAKVEMVRRLDTRAMTDVDGSYRAISADEHENAQENLRMILEWEKRMRTPVMNEDGTGMTDSGLHGAPAATIAAFEELEKTHKGNANVVALQSDIAKGQTYVVRHREERARRGNGAYVA